MRHLVDDVELLDGDLINFVQNINAGDVDPVVTEAVSSCCLQNGCTIIIIEKASELDLHSNYLLQSHVREMLFPSVLQCCNRKRCPTIF